MGRGEGEGICDDSNLIIMMMSEDVLIQIFLYLPVISLLRFKSVCKSWRSIIQNPFFIHLHAITTTTTTKSGGGGGGGGSSSSSSSSFLFFRFPVDREERQERIMFTLSGDKFDVFEELGRPSVEFEEMIEEWGERKTFYDGIDMVGCCNGIICLRDSFSRSVALWNPAIKQSRILPKPSNLLTKNHYNNNTYCFVLDFVGFGIDVTNNKNDYKVLLITSLEPFDAASYDGQYNSEYYGHDRTKFPFARNVQVYSTSTDSWKCIDANLSVAHPDLDIKTSGSPLQLNGRYFFMAQYYIKVVEEEEVFEEEVFEEEEEEEDITDNSSDNNSGLLPMPLIMSFDFTQEIFRTIEFPYDRRSKFYPRSDADLFLFGEKIALNDLLFRSDRLDSECDIWVLNEQQGVMEEEESSWTKFYTFGPYESCYTPLCLVDNGEFAIMHGYDQDPNYQGHNMKLQLLNLSTGESNVLQCDCKGLCHVDVYKPSLVPISGNGATVDKPICGV